MPNFTVRVVESREYLVTYDVDAESIEDLCSEELAYAESMEVQYQQETRLDDSEVQLFIDSVEDDQGNKIAVPEEHSMSFHTIQKLAEDRDNELAKKLLMEISEKWPTDVHEVKYIQLMGVVDEWIAKVRELLDRTGE